MSKKTVEKEISSAFDCLAVTQVQVFPFKEGPSMGHLLGLATIVLNDQFQVRGLRIMEGANGLYVSYPNDPFYKGEDFRSVCCPMTRQLREHIENCVLEKYRASLDPVDWKVRFRLDNDALETIIKETDRRSAIETARTNLKIRFGSVVENAEVELAEEVSE
jgi:stage V sporulation protein G